MKQNSALAMAVLCAPMALAANNDADRPNIVFYMTEDLSPHYLALFNEGKGCDMPELEKLAKEGILYSNAYSNAAVSSAARTTLITGCYAPRLAGSFHRRFEMSPLPQGLRMFPSYLRDRGYFTVNSAKTDYNVQKDKSAWNIASGKPTDWKKRPTPETPFFFVRTNTVTHESSLQFSEKVYQTKPTETSPDSVLLHDYLPDTKLVRYTYATLYDRIHDSDKALGQLVQEIRDAGELDNTFIFFMGDNGGCLPGTKGFTDNIGLQVPLVVYIPKTWRDKIQQKGGSTQAGLVSFMDLGPTALRLAGAEIPEQMDGRPFLGGDSAEANEYVYCYGDRYDECYSINRSVRQGDYRYARNFQPYHHQSLFAAYRFHQLAFREWKELFEAGKLNDKQAKFFLPAGAEELYDLTQDPMEHHNLALDPKFAPQVQSMRKALSSYMVEKADLGLFPETIIFEEGLPNLEAFGKASKERIAQFLEVAQLQILDFKSAQSALRTALSSADDVVAWWALTSVASFAEDAKSLQPDVEKLLAHPRGYVRMRALVALARMGQTPSETDIKAVFKHCQTELEALLVLNDCTYLLESKLVAPFALNMKEVGFKSKDIQKRLAYIAAVLEGGSYLGKEA